MQRGANEGAAAPDFERAPANLSESVATTTEPIEEDDDDLPAPGKVWSNDGPSLSELLKRQLALSTNPPADAPPTAAVVGSNIEAIDPRNLSEVWQLLLKTLENARGVHALVSAGNLVAIEGDSVVLRYSNDHQFHVKALQANGRKEVLADALSQVMGAPMGVRYEMVDAPAAPANGAGATNVGGAASAPVAPTSPPRPTRPPPRIVVPQEPAPVRPGGPPSPDRVQELLKDPLIKALVNDLGGEIKWEE